MTADHRCKTGIFKIPFSCRWYYFFYKVDIKRKLDVNDVTQLLYELLLNRTNKKKVPLYWK